MLGDGKKPRTVLVVCPTHREGEALTKVIREELRDAGRIDKNERSIPRTINLSWTDAEKHDLTEARKVNLQTAKAKTFEFTTEIPKSLSILAWQTDDSWDNVRTHRLNVLASIIMDRMRVELREKLGDTYAPMAANPLNEAFAHYGFLVCTSEISPDKVDETVAAERKIVADIVAKGVTQDELDRAKKPIIEMFVQLQRDGNYWTGYIMGSCQEHPVKLDWARHELDNLRAITVDDINKTAAEYLQPDKAIDIRIMPEAKKEAPEQAKPSTNQPNSLLKKC